MRSPAKLEVNARETSKRVRGGRGGEEKKRREKAAGSKVTRSPDTAGTCSLRFVDSDRAKNTREHEEFSNFKGRYTRRQRPRIREGKELLGGRETR